MSKASKIINIFILIVAIVAVVFGTLLFQKRAQLTQARSDIANTVEKVSRQIDPSATIRSDELKINKTPAEVKEAMVKLESAVDKIVKQRNAIAANLTDVTNTVLEKAYYADGDEPYIVEIESVTDYRGYGDTLTAIKSHVGERMEYIYVRDKHLSDFMSKDGANLGLSAQSYAYSADNAKLSKALLTLLSKTNDTVERMKAFRGHIVTVSSQISPDSRELDLNSQEYPQLLKENVATVETYVKQHKDLIKDNEELRERVRRAEIRLGAADEDTATYRRIAEDADNKTKELENEIRRLRRIIDPTGASSEEEIDFGVLKDLVGKVVFVNEEYGYITINIGTDSSVIRDVINENGVREKKSVRAPVPEGAVLTVATSLDPETAKYVCKAQVIRLRAKASVATILASPAGEFAYPSVGDVVYFSQADIAKMIVARDEANRKRRDESDRAAREKALDEFNEIIGDDVIDDSGIDDFLDEDDFGIEDDFGSEDDFEEE